MTEIIVSIENDWAIDSIINAIKMLKGVSSAKMKKTPFLSHVRPFLLP